MVPNAAVGNWTVLALIKEAKLLKNRIDRNGPMFTRAKTDLSSVYSVQCTLENMLGVVTASGQQTRNSQNMIECENVTAC